MANQYFSCVLDAWVTGTTIHARMHYWRSGTYHYSDSAFPDPVMTIAGTGFTDSGFGNWVRSGIDVGDVYTTEFTKSVSSNGTYGVSFWAGSGVRSDFEGNWSTSVTVTEAVTAPTGLTASNLVKGTRSFTATISITGWGGAGDANSRYRELQVWTVPFETQPRRWAIQKGNSLSGNITADNSSNGTLNLMPNTSYALGAYATNGQISTGNVFWRDATTLPEAATIELVDSDGEGSTFSFTTKLDGGKYDKQIRYSLDGGTTWITAATVSGGVVQTGTFTITGLIAGQTYTLKNRTELANGTYSTGTDVVFTAGSVNRYGSVDGTTRKIVKRYGSVNGQTVSIVKRYGSVNGVTKAI